MQSFNTAFSIGGVALSWNAVMLVLGILTAVIVSGILVKKRKAYKDLALDACIIGIPAGLVGARLFSALSGKIAFASFFSLAEQGMNLPGALLFVGIAIAVYTRIKKLDLTDTFAILLPGAFFGLAVGRWSDFFLCEGLGRAVTNEALQFFPLATFTKDYLNGGTTVAYAIFFLDFLISTGLGVLALLLPKKLDKGRTVRLTVILYLFAEFILEWLRDGSTRQIVFGDVRFNQIVLMAMLLFFIGLSLYRAKRPKTAATPEDGPSEAPESPSEPQTGEDVTPEEPIPDAEEFSEAADEPDAPEADDGDGGDGGDA